MSFSSQLSQPPLVRLMCCAQYDSSRYLARIFAYSRAAYIVAVHVMHMRHAHTEWDNIWPHLCSEQAYAAAKRDINREIMIDLAELCEKFKRGYLLAAFAELQNFNASVEVAVRAVEKYV